MTKGCHFDVEVFSPKLDADVRVVGDISDYHPAVMYLSNGDPGYPAEGGEIEDYRVFDAVGKEIEDPDGGILAGVEDEIWEKVAEDCGP